MARNRETENRELAMSRPLILRSRFSVSRLGNNCRSRSRQTSDLNSGEFSDIRQLFLRRSLPGCLLPKLRARRAELTTEVSNRPRRSHSRAASIDVQELVRVQQDLAEVFQRR